MRGFSRWFVALLVLVAASGVAAAPASAADSSSPNPCALPDALAKSGETAAAHAQYLTVLERNPQAPPQCAETGVAATRPPSGTSVWDKAGNFAKDVGYVIGAIVVVLLVAVVVVLLWLQLQTRVPWLRERWPAHRIRKPVFSVDPLSNDGTDPLGSAVAGLIRGRVTWTTDRFGLNLVSGQAGVASAFSGLGDISNEAKAAVAVITFLTALLPRRRFQLTGQLQPAGEEGVGISLELSQNGDAEALISFWAASFHLCGQPNPNAYQHLAVACAAWVDIWMTKALDGDGLLTGDPQSWAFFRSGVDAQRLGDRDRAQALYEQALAADGTNVGALANLGILYRRMRQWDDAKDYLGRALERTESKSKAPNLEPDENPDWYRIKYQVAALYANWAADKRGSHEEERASIARAEATELATRMLAMLARLEKGGRGQGNAPRAYLQDTLRPFLEGTIESSVLTLLAATVPLSQRPDDWPGARPKRGEISESLARDEIKPWQLIAYVELGSHCPPETQYNLACFYTRAGDLSTAARRLLQAVRETQRQERQRLVLVAMNDPALKPLLDKRPGIEAKLYEMLDDKPQISNMEELTKHFDRQDRAVSYFSKKGYTVNWDVEAKDVDLTAATDTQVCLVTLPSPEEPPSDPVRAASAMVRAYEEQHPNGKHVKTSMVLPAIDENALAIARDRGVEVLVETEDGLQPPAGT